MQYLIASGHILSFTPVFTYVYYLLNEVHIFLYIHVLFIFTGHERAEVVTQNL